MAKPKKEPIKNVKIWIVLGIIFILSVPWYFKTGSYEPLIWGIPLWTWVIAADSVALSAYLTYVLNNHWHMEDDETEDEEGR